jgi:hypothetical protein
MLPRLYFSPNPPAITVPKSQRQPRPSLAGSLASRYHSTYGTRPHADEIQNAAVKIEKSALFKFAVAAARLVVRTALRPERNWHPPHGPGALRNIGF